MIALPYCRDRPGFEGPWCANLILLPKGPAAACRVLLRGHSDRVHCTPKPLCLGFTLVELMIAMTIGVFLLGTLGLVLANNSRTRFELEGSIGQIQNARYALQVLSDDLSNAGFYGEAAVPTGTGLPAFCPSAAALSDVSTAPVPLTHPIQGTNNIDAFPESCTGIDTIRPANDLIVIRRTSTCAVGETGCDPFATGVPHLQQPGCGVAALMVATTADALTGKTRTCATAIAPVYRLYNRVYFLSPFNTSGDGIPTLKRADLTAGGYVSTPIAEGIEHLHFEYGIDNEILGNPGDGEPDVYLRAQAVTDAARWDDVMSVRVYLVARNVTSSKTYQDDKSYQLGQEATITPTTTDRAYKRQAYSTTIRLNNLAGPRED